MDDTIILAEKLKRAWRDLAAEVQRSKKIRFDVFDTTFSQTYSLLSRYLTETSLDKRYVEMIAEAFLFANIKDDALDPSCLAAFVLTERMLAHCAFAGAPAVAEPTSIYIVEARRDILLDFSDVNESVSKLTKVFEDMYWKKVKV